MIAAEETVPETTIVAAQTPQELSAILRPDCAAAVWPREPLTSFQSWIDTLDPAHLPKTRTMLRPGNVRDVASHVCDLCGTPDCAERTMLIDDVAAMADIFAGVMDAPYLLMCLNVVTTNHCRKFHIDAVTARLICTYRGTGTQYGFSPDGGAPPQVFTAPTCAPVLLRGTLWPQNADARLLHRSPPIEGTGETRLVLVLDPVAEPEDHPAWEFLTHAHSPRRFLH